MFSYLEILCLGCKIGYKRHTMSLLDTSKDFFPRRTQNSNSEGQKTSIFIVKVPFTLHLWIRLIYTNTYAKEQKKIPVLLSK